MLPRRFRGASTLSEKLLHCKSSESCPDVMKAYTSPVALQVSEKDNFRTANKIGFIPEGSIPSSIARHACCFRGHCIPHNLFELHRIIEVVIEGDNSSDGSSNCKQICSWIHRFSSNAIHEVTSMLTSSTNEKCVI